MTAERAFPSTLDAAMAAFQADLPSITKDEKATVKSDKGSYSYGYAGLDTVSEKVLRALGKLGVSWRTRPTLNTEGKFVLAYRLRHVSGEEETGEWPLAGGTPQQVGSSITYARRYALMAVTGVFPGDEDDDGAAASTAPRDDWGAASPIRPRREPPRPVEQPAEDASGVPMVTQQHHKRMHALWRELGFDGEANRDTRLEITGRFIGRELESSSHLTADEAAAVIEQLEARRRLLRQQQSEVGAPA